jgi:sulfur-carrier protein adenylyltransferase/sulfurtransferase
MTEHRSPFHGFSTDELQRYARHFTLEEVGGEGQRRLRDARILLVGAGGLGSPAALYLAAAGVGHLGIVDGDRVELSNLQRQILHGTDDVGREKVASARERLREVNPHVEVEALGVRLTSANAMEIVRRFDVVVDGSDNFPTRYLVNDACVLSGRPWVYGAVLRWEGQLSVFGVAGGPCYRCLFREPPPPGMVPGCAEAGVLGLLPGVIGSLQALEAVKLVLGEGEGMAGRLLIFDSMALSFREVSLRRDPSCPVCGDEPTIHELIDYEHFCETGQVRGAHETPGPSHTGAPGGLDEDGVARAVAGDRPETATLDPETEIGSGELARRLGVEAPAAARSGAGSGPAEEPPFLLDVRERWEWEVSNLGAHGARLIPVDEVERRLEEVPRDREVVVYCRTGARSDRVARALREAGFSRVRNLVGGMKAWAREVDPDLPVA